MMKFYHNGFTYIAATIGWSRNTLKSFPFYPVRITGILPRCINS